MFKKFIAVGLSLTVVLSLANPVSAASVSYSDVKSSDWYYSSLGSMSDNKIISGYPDGTFRASDTLNVDAFLAMHCRLTDNDVGLGDTYWAQNYIDFALSQGWMDGLSISDYSKPINRFETARLTVKALGFSESNYPATYQAYEVYVGDYSRIPSKYKDDVLVNYTLGITRGYPDGTFQGYNTLTRAEGAVISHRIFDESVRKPPLVPDKTAELMAMFAALAAASAPPALAPLEGEVVMDGPVMAFPSPSYPVPIPMPSIPLEPEISVITENVLADTIIEMSDEESTNALAAGYNYGIFNINILTEENDSLVLFTTEQGSSVVTIDLLQLTAEDGTIPKDAIDFLRLICQNVDYNNSEAMLAWILDNYKNRLDIPEDGNDIFFDDTLMGISSLIHDHNVLRVIIQTGVEVSE